MDRNEEFVDDDEPDAGADDYVAVQAVAEEEQAKAKAVVEAAPATAPEELPPAAAEPADAPIAAAEELPPPTAAPPAEGSGPDPGALCTVHLSIVPPGAVRVALLPEGTAPPADRVALPDAPPPAPSAVSEPPPTPAPAPAAAPSPAPAPIYSTTKKLAAAAAATTAATKLGKKAAGGRIGGDPASASAKPPAKPPPKQAPAKPDSAAGTSAPASTHAPASPPQPRRLQLTLSFTPRGDGQPVGLTIHVPIAPRPPAAPKPAGKGVRAGRGLGGAVASASAAAALKRAAARSNAGEGAAEGGRVAAKAGRAASPGEAGGKEKASMEREAAAKKKKMAKAAKEAAAREEVAAREAAREEEAARRREAAAQRERAEVEARAEAEARAGAGARAEVEARAEAEAQAEAEARVEALVDAEAERAQAEAEETMFFDEGVAKGAGYAEFGSFSHPAALRAAPRGGARAGGNAAERTRRGCRGAKARLSRTGGVHTSAAQIVHAERARYEESLVAMLTPLLESERRAAAEMQQRMQQVAIERATHGATAYGAEGPARHDAGYIEGEYCGVKPHGDFAHRGSPDSVVNWDEASLLRQRTKMLREAEICALEQRLAAAMGRGGGRGEEGENELVEEEAISSVVQHLSPFGINRNLPWQIYATRPKRFSPLSVSEPGDATNGADASHSYEAYRAEESGRYSPFRGAPQLPQMPSGIGCGLYDGGSSSIGEAAGRHSLNGPAVLRSVYGQPIGPHGARRYGTAQMVHFPPVRGAVAAIPGAPIRSCWASPREPQRLSSPRVLRAPGAYL